MAGSTSDPGPAPRPDGPGAPGPDADLIAAIDDTAGRSVLGALRRGPRTVGQLTAATGHAEPAVWAALHALTEQGVVAADHPRLPGDVTYRIDGAALTGFRGLGRWFRSRSSPPVGHRSAAAAAPERAPAADGTAGDDVSEAPAAAVTDDPPATPSGTGGEGTGPRAAPTSSPSVAAWTNPAVKAALRRLDEQQRRPR